MNQSCRVCGEAAAGFHFGAFTCEGCKSFFGRTYNNRSSIGECKNNNSCVINKKNRTSCKACRLKKCFFAGMSKQGSRYGRRSNWFKIHCLLQDQQQQQQHQQHQHQQQQQQHQQTSLPGQERPLDLQQAHLAHNQQIRADSTSLSSALGQLELHQQHHQQLPSPPVGSSPLELAGSRQQQPSSTTSSSSSSSSSSSAAAAATAPPAPTHAADPSMMALYASFLLQQQQIVQQRAAQQQAQQQQLDNLSQLAHLQNLGKGAELANDVGVPAPQPGAEMNAFISLLQALATVQTFQQPR